MPDKQIIIDGVDVSGCKYYVANNGVEAQGCYELTDLCKCYREDEFCYRNPNCYYKQLKRKEQECERLKRDYFKQNEWLQEQKKELDQLKAENEELEKRKLKLELNENHNKNKIKKLKKRIRKDREMFINKISKLTLAREAFLETLDHFNWQIDLVIKEYTTKQFCDNCEEIGSTELTNHCENAIKTNYKYKQALDEIEEVCKDGAYDEFKMPLDENSIILDIISKAKEQEC